MPGLNGKGPRPNPVTTIGKFVADYVSNSSEIRDRIVFDNDGYALTEVIWHLAPSDIVGLRVERWDINDDGDIEIYVLADNIIYTEVKQNVLLGKPR